MRTALAGSYIRYKEKALSDREIRVQANYRNTVY